MEHADFPMTIEDAENTTGGNSELLLHTNLEKRQEATGVASFREVINGRPIGTQPTTSYNKGQVFPGKRICGSNLKLKDNNVTIAYYQEESRCESASCFVGLRLNTNREQYPHDAGIVVHVRDMCGLQKPKLIGDVQGDFMSGHGVVVYQAIQLENSSLRPIVKCFSKNKEDKVPKELVKIGRKV